MSRIPAASLRLLALLAALALALFDAGLRLSADSPPWPVPIAPSIEILSRGAPFHRFPVLTSSYFTYAVRWMTLPCIVLASLLLFHRLGGWRARGVLTAVALVGMFELMGIQRIPQPWRFTAHPTRVWAMRPHIVEPNPPMATTDAEGYRLTPPSGPSPVAMLGDSTTFGATLRQCDRTFCWMLGEALTAKGGPGVINRGVPGYTTWQGLLVLRETLAREHPKLVVAAYMANDWTWSEQPDSALGLDGVAGTLRAMLRERTLYLALEHLLLDDPVDVPEAQRQGPACRVPVAQFEANLTAMRDMCASHGVPILFMSLPMAPVLDDVSAPYRAAMMRVAKTTGSTLVDIHSDWKARGWSRRFFQPTDPIHPNADGHAEITRTLIDVVSKALNLPPGSPH